MKRGKKKQFSLKRTACTEILDRREHCASEGKSVDRVVGDKREPHNEGQHHLRQWAVSSSWSLI